MTFEDAQHQAELQELKNDAQLLLSWRESMRLVAEDKGFDFDFESDSEWFEIPAFIREEAEEEMKANPFKD